MSAKIEKMKAKEFIPLLGLTSDDKKVTDFLAACRISKQPKPSGGSESAFVENEKIGLELTFRDERHIPVKYQEYEDGAFVLWNVRMYGEADEDFSRFDGELPFGLNFHFGRKEAEAKMGKKPSWENQEMTRARWDFKEYCVFLTYGKQPEEIRTVSIQLPVA